MQGSGFTRREIVCWDLNIQYRGCYKQTWIYVDTTKRGILCKYNHLDVFYYYRIIYVHVKMLDIYGYRPFPFRICISGGSSAVAVLIIATLYGPSRIGSRSMIVGWPRLVPWPWGRERGPGAGLTLGQLGPPSPSWFQSSPKCSAPTAQLSWSNI